MLKTYLLLTKPGIVVSNAFAAVAGFALGAKGEVMPGLFAATVAGLALIIASACIFNNYIDRDIDRKMARTKRRPLVTGSISGFQALGLAVLLLLFGSWLIGNFANSLALGVALFGFFMYVVVYGYAKRKSTLGTIIGSVSGAVPPVVGYVAVTGRLDAAAWLLFILLTLWQMPHFYAIAIYRLKDYKAAGIPTLPVKKGFERTKLSILLYMVAFAVAVPLLTIYGYTGYIFAAVMTILSLYWIRVFLIDVGPDKAAWAGRVFHFSLIVLTVFCAMLILNPLLV